MKKLLFILSLIIIVSCGKDEPQKTEDVKTDNQNQNQVDISNFEKNIKIETSTVMYDVAKYEISFPGSVITAPENIYIVSSPV